MTEKINVTNRLVSAPRQKISNLLRFKNGFQIRDLHHFASKNVPHTTSQILRVTKIQQIKVKSADVEKSLFLKIPNLLRFENGFEIRDLHHFADKNVPHTISQVLRVTEIQQFRSNQLMLKIVIFKNFQFDPIRKRFRDSGSASLCGQKCPPHHLSSTQGYRDTTI